MTRRLVGFPVAALLALALAPSAWAHNITTVTITPNPVAAGDKVTLSVSGVEPNSQRAIVLIGQGIVVQFPTVQTDASGSFTSEVTIPSRLPGGTYRFEAIGDETLTGEVDVMAAAGGIAAQAAPAQAVPDARTRSTIETVLIVMAAGIALLAGLALILGPERFGGAGEA